jgi:hypothetical protein
MVRHEAVRKKRDAKPFQRRDEQPLEGAVVGVAFEKQAFSRSAVENVKHQTGSYSANASWHDGVERNHHAGTASSCAATVLNK